MSKKFVAILVFVLIIIFHSSIEVYAAANNSEIYLSDKDLESIEEFINQQMNNGDIPGLSVTIVKEDKTLYQGGFGYSDIDSQQPVTSDTLFELGSNSKAFTALGVLKLAKDKKIHIEAPITDYIPWLKMEYKGQEATVTVEDILYHTSGIPFNTIDKIPVSTNQNAIEETVRTLQGIELDSVPGEIYQYATINYDILGLLIENVTGDTYEAYIQKNVLEPMSLNNTYLYNNEFDAKLMAQGYKPLWLKPHKYEAPNYAGNKPAGYIISNGIDMGKWLKIQLGTSKESRFDKELINASHDPNHSIKPLSDGASYAAGWFVYQNGGGELAHGGNNPNYSSYLFIRPEERIGIAVLSNINSKYVENLALGIDQILLNNNTTIEDVMDVNLIADYISIAIIGASMIVIVLTLLMSGKVIWGWVQKKRYVEKTGKQGIIKIVISFTVMLILSVCIYLIPYIFYNGVNWDFIFVWLPQSVKWAVVLFCICIWIVYAYSILVSYVKKK